MDRDFYADLGVSRNATSDEIGSAFRKLAARYHPDRNPGDRTAEEKFKRIAEAYNVLRDPKSRAAYDRGGSEQVRVDTGFRGFDSTEDIFSHFGDIFGDLFGARFRSRAYRRWPDEFDVEPEPDLDLHREVTISVFTALLGGTVDVPTAEGTAEMTVPPGDPARAEVPAGEAGTARPRRPPRRRPRDRPRGSPAPTDVGAAEPAGAGPPDPLGDLP